MDGNIVNQGVIVKPVGVFPGNHSGGRRLPDFPGGVGKSCPDFPGKQTGTKWGCLHALSSQETNEFVYLIIILFYFLFFVFLGKEETVCGTV